MKDCLFCRIVEHEIPSQEVYSDDDCYAFRDISPQAPVHILIVPRRHVASLSELEDRSLAGHLVLTAGKIAAGQGLDDYRLVANRGARAGQSVFHLHWHLLGGRDFSWPPG